MKTALAAIVLLSLVSGLAAQSRQPSAQSAAPAQTATQPAAIDLNSVLADLQRVALSTNADLGKLRIEKWKADSSQRQQMQEVANSLQRNISSAVPSLITEAQAAPGSVSKTFKLYDNINIVYEFLNSLAEAAGAFGKREEYEPLANDASSLDKIRRTLSDYIQQRAVVLETPPKPATESQTTQPAPKKIVIDDSAPPKKTKKKKSSTASTPPASSNPPQ
jgi:hypothetical protein